MDNLKNQIESNINTFKALILAHGDGSIKLSYEMVVEIEQAITKSTHFINLLDK